MTKTAYELLVSTKSHNDVCLVNTSNIIILMQNINKWLDDDKHASESFYITKHIYKNESDEKPSDYVRYSVTQFLSLHVIALQQQVIEMHLRLLEVEKLVSPKLEAKEEAKPNESN